MAYRTRKVSVPGLPSNGPTESRGKVSNLTITELFYLHLLRMAKSSLKTTELFARKPWKRFEPVRFEILLDFTLSDARRFYSSKGDPWE